ncbi:serine integrase family protein [Archangium violaceum]|uniref:hypothetical protein n=1 Tax=Archangium violaceum TaxID=83451 RepID=UPI0036D895A3
MLDLCGLADVLLADEQAVYTPRDYNDRLLLGLKGTMSEAELYWMRLRLQGGRLSKARRGALHLTPPVGYEWEEATSRFRFDPDEGVQRAVRLVFERFRLEDSAYAVLRYFMKNGLKLPCESRARTNCTRCHRTTPCCSPCSTTPPTPVPMSSGAMKGTWRWWTGRYAFMTSWAACIVRAGPG